MHGNRNVHLRFPSLPIIAVVALVLLAAVSFCGCKQDETGACVKKYWDALAGDWVYTCLGDMTKDECNEEYQQWGQVVGFHPGDTCGTVCPTCDNIF